MGEAVTCAAAASDGRSAVFAALQSVAVDRAAGPVAEALPSVDAVLHLEELDSRILLRLVQPCRRVVAGRVQRGWAQPPRDDIRGAARDGPTGPRRAACAAAGSAAALGRSCDRSFSTSNLRKAYDSDCDCSMSRCGGWLVPATKNAAYSCHSRLAHRVHRRPDPAPHARLVASRLLHQRHRLLQWCK